MFRKKHTKNPNLSYNDAVEEAICFGWVDGIKRSLDDNRYMHRFSPRKAGSQWSQSNKKRVERMQAAGQMAPAGQRSVDAAKASGAWDNPVKPPPPFEMPAEFRARLARNRKASAFFDSLAPSYRREFVDWVASAKRDDTRKRRLQEAMRLLTRGLRLGMR